MFIKRKEPSQKSFIDHIRQRIDAEPYWFHKIDLGNGLVTPGWSTPATEKLPHFGIPKDMRGLRVLDIGCSEGFFAFEAERRGAAEVVAIDSSPDSIRRFNICREALGAQAQGFLTNVYDLSPKTFGTFDMVFFYGVLYHLRHPLLALEKILAVTTGTLLFQTATFDDQRESETPVARFFPRGFMSGTKEKPLFDPTVFWMPNPACAMGLLENAGFVDIEVVSPETFTGIVLRAKSPVQAKGTAPDHAKAPWS